MFTGDFKDVFEFLEIRLILYATTRVPPNNVAHELIDAKITTAIIAFKNLIFMIFRIKFEKIFEFKNTFCDTKKF